MKQKRIEIAFELARVFVFGNRQRDHVVWCLRCQSYVPMVSTFTAASLEKTNLAVIFRRAETGELHHVVTNKGELLICFSSLLDPGRETDKKTFDFPEVEPEQINYLLR